VSLAAALAASLAGGAICHVPSKKTTNFPNLWRWNVNLQDLSYNRLNMRVHTKALQHAQRICKKILLQRMLLNEEKNSTMAKS
jgi:hypothetical protein